MNLSNVHALCHFTRTITWLLKPAVHYESEVRTTSSWLVWWVHVQSGNCMESSCCRWSHGLQSWLRLRALTVYKDLGLMPGTSWQLTSVCKPPPGGISYPLPSAGALSHSAQSDKCSTQEIKYENLRINKGLNCYHSTGRGFLQSRRSLPSLDAVERVSFSSPHPKSLTLLSRLHLQDHVFAQLWKSKQRLLSLSLVFAYCC